MAAYKENPTNENLAVIAELAIRLAIDETLIEKRRNNVSR